MQVATIVCYSKFIIMSLPSFLFVTILYLTYVGILEGTIATKVEEYEEAIKERKET